MTGTKEPALFRRTRLDTAGRDTDRVREIQFRRFIIEQNRVREMYDTGRHKIFTRKERETRVVIRVRRETSARYERHARSIDFLSLMLIG